MLLLIQNYPKGLLSCFRSAVTQLYSTDLTVVADNLSAAKKCKYILLYFRSPFN